MVEKILLVDDDSRIHVHVGQFVTRFNDLKKKNLELIGVYSIKDAQSAVLKEAKSIKLVLQDGELNQAQNSLHASMEFISRAVPALPGARFVAISLADTNNEYLIGAGCHEALAKSELVKGGPLLRLLNKIFNNDQP